MDRQCKATHSLGIAGRCQLPETHTVKGDPTANPLHQDDARHQFSEAEAEYPPARVAMPVAEFQEDGYLQEVNRQLLHPAGLALSVADRTALIDVDDLKKLIEYADAGVSDLPPSVAAAGVAEFIGAMAELAERFETEKVLYDVWDMRDDPEGIFYGVGDEVTAEKTRTVHNEIMGHAECRAMVLDPSGSGQVRWSDLEAARPEAPWVQGLGHLIVTVDASDGDRLHGENPVSDVLQAMVDGDGGINPANPGPAVERASNAELINEREPNGPAGEVVAALTAGEVRHELLGSRGPVETVADLPGLEDVSGGERQPGDDGPSGTGRIAMRDPNGPAGELAQDLATMGARREVRGGDAPVEHVRAYDLAPEDQAKVDEFERVVDPPLGPTGGEVAADA